MNEFDRVDRDFRMPRQPLRLLTDLLEPGAQWWTYSQQEIAEVWRRYHELAPIPPKESAKSAKSADS
jgi:hypothetical protein